MTLAGGTFAKGNFSEGTSAASGIGALTLTATGSHIDFGTGTVGVLTFASFAPGTFNLTIDNWTGTLNTVGTSSTDRLIFNSDQTANLSHFVFTGYSGPVGEFNLGNGFFEVVPVPESSTWPTAAMAVGIVGFYLVKGRRRRAISHVEPVRFRPLPLLVIGLTGGQLLLCGPSTATTASPAEEISAALETANSTSGRLTSDATFLRAWRAVVSGANESSVRAYVAAAVKLRCPLAPAIVDSSLSVLIPLHKRRLTERDLVIIRETIQGALECNPKAAAAVVAAALSVQRFARDEIVAAAILAAPDQREAIAEAARPFSPALSFMRLSGDKAVAALNAWNVDLQGDQEDKLVRSPEKNPE
jgi:hypothetical protein